MAILMRSKSQIYGLNTDLQNINLAIQAEETRAKAAELLNTQAVQAEELARGNEITRIDGLKLNKASNLSDVADAGTSRQNLDVYSTGQVDSAINAAKLALGTNHVVATNSDRNALADLDVADTVMVVNGGDWVKYGVESVVGGVASFFVMTSKAEYENANSAAAVKVAYESNANTNAFTDAEQTKVGLLSITTARDLDKLIQSDELVTDGTLAGVTDTQIASAAAVKTFVSESVRTGGALFKSESIVVASDKIVLAFAAKDGMILNFNTVRHVDSNGIAFDIPVVKDPSDSTGKTYILSPDTTGEFDGKSVAVQYPYIAV